MASIKELILYLIFCLWPLGMIILFVSQIKESIIHKKGVYPAGVNKFFRPWGLKIKELKMVQNDVKDESLKSKIGQIIYLRKLGFRLLLLFPVMWITFLVISALTEK